MAPSRTWFHDMQEHRSLERATQVVELRVAGKRSWRQIGEEVGISHTQARKLYLKALEQAATKLVDTAQHALVIELMRLDDLWEINFERATDRDRDVAEQQSATEKCLKISIERRRMLGLDAPGKVEITGADGGPVVFAEVQTLEGEALDKELEGFFNPGYMEGVADGFVAGEESAKKNARKKKRKPATEAKTVTESEPVAEVEEEQPVIIAPPSAGRARV